MALNLWGRRRDPSVQIPGDISGTREALEFAVRKLHVYFFMVMGLTGAVLFLVGLFGWGVEGRAALDQIPEPVLLMAVGVVGFSLFFPMFLALYFARHFLVTVRHLERQVADLQATVARLSAAAPRDQ